MFQGRVKWCDYQPGVNSIWEESMSPHHATTPATKWKLFHVWEDKIEYEPHYTLYGFIGKLDCLVVW